MKKLLLFALFISSFIGHSQTLDTTFNGTGVVTTLCPNIKSSESIISSEMQPDGKMVYLGKNYKNNIIYGFFDGAFIARYNTDGTLDTTFNSCGFRIFKNNYLVTLGLMTSAYNFYNLKIQSDGKFLVSVDSNLYRFNVDGSYDTTFGINGQVQVSYNNYNLNFQSIKIQSDNKIILRSSPETIVRLNSNGTLDTTFGNDGILVLNFGSPWGEKLHAIAIQDDGKLIIVVMTFNYISSTSTQGNFNLITARLNSDGSIDNSFGTNGITSSLGPVNDFPQSQISLQADGKILVAVTMYPYTVTVVRYNIDGSIDATFNTNGIENFNDSNAIDGTVSAIKSLEDGKILVMANGDSGYNNVNPVFKIYKLNSDGNLDNSFASNGEFYSNPINSDAKSFFLKNDGSIVIAGSFIDLSSNPNDDTFLHRLNKIELSANGLLQNSTIFNLKQNFNEFNGVIEQANGKIIVSCNPNKLVRYNLDGSIDTTFGTNGNIDLSNTFSNKIVKQPDGNFLLYQTNYSKVYRRNSDGTLDTSFGINGELSLPEIGYINTIYPTNNNKLFLLSTDYSYFIQKLNNDGTTDTSFVLDFDTFGQFGRFNFYDDFEGETSENMIIQSDNKIIIAVSLIGSNNGYVATGLIRFNPNGSLDTTFGTNGKIVIQENNFILSKKMCLLENDSFVINFDIGVGETKLYKYNSNGTLDSNFINNGILDDIYSNNDLIVQPDFKILKSTNVNNQFTTARYDNVTGALDTTFGTNGFINTPIGLGSNINQLTWLQNNTLLASGTSFDGTNEVIALARYVNLNLGTLTFTNQNAQSLVYPNPIQEEATFEYTVQNDEIVSIEIIDMQGRIVQTIVKNKELSQGNYKQTINLSNLTTSGNYILKFSSSKGSEAIKIIKK